MISIADAIKQGTIADFNQKLQKLLIQQVAQHLTWDHYEVKFGTESVFIGRYGGVTSDTITVRIPGVSRLRGLIGSALYACAGATVSPIMEVKDDEFFTRFEIDDQQAVVTLQLRA